MDQSSEINAENSYVDKFPQISQQFEYLYMIGILWLLAGSYADGWSHAHIPDLEKVFSPAHILLYTGAGLLSMLIVYTAMKNLARGYNFKYLMPFGYKNSLIGVLIFGISGPGDLFWHATFGIEQDIEATFSPTHFGAMVGIFLMFSAPYVSRIQQKSSFERIPLSILPSIISATATLSLFSLITIWAHPFRILFPSLLYLERDTNQGFGMVSIMIQTIFFISIVLYSIREDVFSKWSYTLILGVNGGLIQLIANNFFLLPVYILTGLFIDLLVDKYRSNLQNLTLFRIIAFAAPALMYALYFLFVSIFRTLWWSIHSWSGGIFIAGIVGLMVSYLVIPIKTKY